MKNTYLNLRKVSTLAALLAVFATPLAQAEWDGRACDRVLPQYNETLTYSLVQNHINTVTDLDGDGRFKICFRPGTTVNEDGPTFRGLSINRDNVTLSTTDGSGFVTFKNRGKPQVFSTYMLNISGKNARVANIVFYSVESAVDGMSLTSGSSLLDASDLMFNFGFIPATPLLTEAYDPFRIDTRSMTAYQSTIGTLKNIMVQSEHNKLNVHGLRFEQCNVSKIDNYIYNSGITSKSTLTSFAEGYSRIPVGLTINNSTVGQIKNVEISNADVAFSILNSTLNELAGFKALTSSTGFNISRSNINTILSGLLTETKRGFSIQNRSNIGTIRVVNMSLFAPFTDTTLARLGVGIYLAGVSTIQAIDNVEIKSETVDMQAFNFREDVTVNRMTYLRIIPSRWVTSQTRSFISPYAIVNLFESSLVYSYAGTGSIEGKQYIKLVRNVFEQQLR